MDPFTCLAVAIFFEARGESFEGKEAVANVIVNRVEDRRYPNDVCEVVWEPKAFSFTHDGLSDKPEKYSKHADRLAWKESKQVAKKVLAGDTLGISSTHYHASYVSPFWTEHYELDGQIGVHVFYTNTTPYK